jgi:hypothetical protein
MCPLLPVAERIAVRLAVWFEMQKRVAALTAPQLPLGPGYSTSVRKPIRHLLWPSRGPQTKRRVTLLPATRRISRPL